MVGSSLDSSAASTCKLASAGSDSVKNVPPFSIVNKSMGTGSLTRWHTTFSRTSASSDWSNQCIRNITLVNTDSRKNNSKSSRLNKLREQPHAVRAFCVVDSMREPPISIQHLREMTVLPDAITTCNLNECSIILRVMNIHPP